MPAQLQMGTKAMYYVVRLRGKWMSAGAGVDGVWGSGMVDGGVQDEIKAWKAKEPRSRARLEPSNQAPLAAIHRQVV